MPAIIAKQEAAPASTTARSTNLFRIRNYLTLFFSQSLTILPDIDLPTSDALERRLLSLAWRRADPRSTE
jgi:hypothetical protein